MNDTPRIDSTGANPFTQVPIEITISVGKARPLVRDLLRLKADAILPLDRRVDDPVELYVGDRLIARQPDKCARTANRDDGRRRAASAARAGAIVERVVLLVERELGIGKRCRSAGRTACGPPLDAQGIGHQKLPPSTSLAAFSLIHVLVGDE